MESLLSGPMTEPSREFKDIRTGGSGENAPALAVDEFMADLEALQAGRRRGFGDPPPASDMSQFKIVIPKRGEERNDAPDAGKGGTKVRKG